MIVSAVARLLRGSKSSEIYLRFSYIHPCIRASERCYQTSAISSPPLRTVSSLISGCQSHSVVLLHTHHQHFSQPSHHVYSTTGTEQSTITNTNTLTAPNKSNNNWSSRNRNSRGTNSFLNFKPPADFYREERRPFTLTEDSWMSRFKELTEFIAEHQRLPSTSIYDCRTIEERRLAKWAIKQRSNKWYLKHHYPELYQMLDKTNLWCWNGRDIPWEKKFQNFLKFIEKNGRLPMHNRVTRLSNKKIVRPDNEATLAAWMNMQKKERHTLEEKYPYRFNRLNECSYWSWDRKHNTWEKSFEQLDLFVAEHGRYPQWTALFHYNNPKEIDDSSIDSSRTRRSQDSRRYEWKLRDWLSLQRRLLPFWKEKRPDRYHKLVNASWWHWRTRYDDLLWQTMYEAVETFRSVHKRFPRRPQPRVKVPEREKALGNWIHTQRSMKEFLRQKRPDRYQQLNNAPWWKWAVKKHRNWHEFYTKVGQFVSEKKRLPRQKRHSVDEAESVLGDWVKMQRQNISYLTTHRKDLAEILNKTPWWEWFQIDFQWQDFFNKIDQFYNSNSSFPDKKRLPKDTWANGIRTEEMELGRWMDWQRSRKQFLKENCPDRYSTLDQTTWWSWEREFDVEDWENRYRATAEFVKIVGRLPRRASVGNTSTTIARGNVLHDLNSGSSNSSDDDEGGGGGGGDGEGGGKEKKSASLSSSLSTYMSFKEEDLGDWVYWNKLSKGYLGEHHKNLYKMLVDAPWWTLWT